VTAPVDVLAVMDRDAADADAHRLHLTVEPIDKADIPSTRRSESDEARAAVAELLDREAKQRDVLERLCEAYIANRHAMGVHDFVKCITPGGNRCADSETGRLWLEAAALARCKGGAK